jgi:hypothetical protein
VCPARPFPSELTANHSALRRSPTDHLPSHDGFVRIDVGAGDQLKTFNVHVALLKARSRFFKEALSGKWKEAEEKVVRLPEYCPTMFETYVHNLYTGDLAVASEKEQAESDEMPERYQSLAHFYVFAEKMKDVKSKNSILRAILACRSTVYSSEPYTCPSTEAIDVIYNGTLAGSPARRLMIDLWTKQATAEYFDKELPGDFMRDLLVRIVNVRRASYNDIKIEEYMEANKEEAQ